VTEPSDATEEKTKTTNSEFTDRAQALAIDPRQARTVEDFRALQAVYLTNLPKTAEWGKDLSREGAFALAKAAATTGLDPLLGHILMLGGKITVSLVGIMHVANLKENEAIYDGFTCDPLTADERTAYKIPEYEHAFKCLTYRKDRSHPIPGVGRASKDNVKMAQMQIWLIELAQKRAIERSHRIAFNLPFLGEDEPDDSPNPMKIVRDASAAANGSVEGGGPAGEVIPPPSPEAQAVERLMTELRFSAAKRKLYREQYPDDQALMKALEHEHKQLGNARGGGRTLPTEQPKEETPPATPAAAAEEQGKPVGRLLDELESEGGAA
jgi:hypothetical protein